ncbi:MAG TPA: hypothetical protein VM737_01945 [Gemmatimonadota bacterium]|nr:hypothetical protein [Gemmatimonadota bacterium]
MFFSALSEPDVFSAVILTPPDRIPVTVPPPLTVAIPVFDELQLRAGGKVSWPFLSNAVTLKVQVLHAGICSQPG